VFAGAQGAHDQRVVAGNPNAHHHQVNAGMGRHLIEIAED
jgi:hypothetical protein